MLNLKYIKTKVNFRSLIKQSNISMKKHINQFFKLKEIRDFHVLTNITYFFIIIRNQISMIRIIIYIINNLNIFSRIIIKRNKLILNKSKKKRKILKNLKIMKI